MKAFLEKVTRYFKRSRKLHLGPFFLVFILSLLGLVFALDWIHKLVGSTTSSTLSIILYTPLSESFGFLLFWIAGVSIIFGVMISLYWTLLPNLIKTPFFFQYSFHGFHYGLLAALIAHLIRHWHDFQSAYIFPGDFVVLAVGLTSLYILIQQRLTVSPEEQPENTESKTSADEEPDSSSPFSLDEQPINSAAEDLLGYTAIAGELERALALQKGVDLPGRRVVLYGSSGSGKTSVLSILREALFEKNANVEIVDFHPFLYKNQTELTTAFFQTISDAIGKDCFLPGLHNLPELYLRLIYGIGENLKLKLASVMELFQRTKTVEELRAMLESYATFRDMNVLILIDDLDRCSLQIRYHLLRLMDVVGNAKRIHYVIAASPNELLNQEEPKLVTLVD